MKYLTIGIISGVLFLAACGTETKLEEPITDVEVLPPTATPEIKKPADNQKEINMSNNFNVEIMQDFEKKYNEKTESYVISMETVIKNIGTENLMEVSYQVDIKDKDGNIIDTVSPKWTGENIPLYPDQTINHHYGFQDKFDGKEPVSTEVKVIGVKTDKEITPIHLPEPGEYWYQAINNEYVNNIKEKHPTKIKVIIDHMGAQDVFEVKDEEEINKLVDAFTKIKIAQETTTWVTDNYNWICFTFEDGTEVNLSLNLYNYDMFAYGHEHLYELENLGDFLALTKEEKW